MTKLFTKKHTINSFLLVLTSFSFILLTACGGETETTKNQSDATHTNDLKPKVEESSQDKPALDFSKGRMTVKLNNKESLLAISDCRGIIFKSGDKVMKVAISMQANDGSKEVQFQMISEPPFSANVKGVIDGIMEGNVPAISLDKNNIHLKGNVMSNDFMKAMKGEKGKTLPIDIEANCVEGYSQQSWE